MKRILLAVLIVTSSCSTTRNLKIGCYEAKNENLIAYYHLQLRQDSSYNFNLTGDMHDSNLEGRWRIRGNSLILNSDIQPTTKGYFKESPDSTTKGQIQLLLFDIYGNPLNNKNHVYIHQQSDYLSLTTETGNSYLIGKNLLRHQFSVGIGIDYKETMVKVKNPSTSKIFIYLCPDTRGYFQINTKFKIKDSISFSIKKLIFSKTECYK